MTIDYAIITPVMMFERYGDGILEIIFSGADPAEAVARCEAKEEK